MRKAILKFTLKCKRVCAKNMFAFNNKFNK